MTFLLTLETLRDSGKLPRITYEILTELVKKKREQKKRKKAETAAGFFLMFAISAAMASFVIPVDGRSPRSGVLNGFADRPLSVMLLLAAFAAVSVFMRMHAKREEAEEDFEALRKEVIDRAGELWIREPGDEGRYETMKYLLHRQDINLFYK